MIQWDTLLSRSRELSMSGILGLVETDILYADPGTEQPEIWRVLQAMVGLGCLRVISRICKAPCWESLHHMYGIKPPESVEAREFWLRQPSWTEISRLGMTQEDTSYHRINQGSGPQLRILWDAHEIQEEYEWWNEENDAFKHRDSSPSIFIDGAPTPPLKRDSLTVTELRRTRSGRALSVSSNGKSQNRDGLTKGETPEIYITRKGNSVSEGTTDKWFMDRWQCEVLAVACVHHLSIAEASEVLTVAYFGHSDSSFWHIVHGVICFLLSSTTFVTAALTDWAWIQQFVALTCLGYFANRTASLRAWRFEPNSALKEIKPELLKQWPLSQEDTICVRIAVQSSGFCHLRGLITFRDEDIRKARDVAQTHVGRWKSNRKSIRFVKPYGQDNVEDMTETQHWLSYEVQSSWFGLVSTVEPDNFQLRSFSVVATLVNGLLLLIIGFGSSIKAGWNGIVLGIFAAGIVVAILARERGSQWTMPEFEVVDLTNKRLPPFVRQRLMKAKVPLLIEEKQDDLGLVEEIRTHDATGEKSSASDSMV